MAQWEIAKHKKNNMMFRWIVFALSIPEKEPSKFSFELLTFLDNPVAQLASHAHSIPADLSNSTKSSNLINNPCPDHSQMNPVQHIFSFTIPFVVTSPEHLDQLTFPGHPGYRLARWPAFPGRGRRRAAVHEGGGRRWDPSAAGRSSPEEQKSVGWCSSGWLQWLKFKCPLCNIVKLFRNHFLGLLCVKAVTPCPQWG